MQRKYLFGKELQIRQFFQLVYFQMFTIPNGMSESFKSSNVSPFPNVPVSLASKLSVVSQLSQIFQTATAPRLSEGPINILSRLH